MVSKRATTNTTNSTATKKRYLRQHTYNKMVQHVMLQNKSGKFESPQRILGNVREVFPVDSERALQSIWKELKTGAESGVYVRSGNSFRLSTNCRNRLRSKSTKKRGAKKAKVQATTTEENPEPGEVAVQEAAEEVAVEH